MTDKKFTKICGVCGDKAIGKNFGALSCEPCKAFFRRNALKNEFECHFDGKCEINAITRKFCQKCRLNKCFAVGMKNESIANDAKKQLRKNNLEVKDKMDRKYSFDGSDSGSTLNIFTESMFNDINLETNCLTELFGNYTISDEKTNSEIIQPMAKERDETQSYLDLTNCFDLSENIVNESVEKDLISEIFDNKMISGEDINEEIMEIEKYNNCNDMNIISDYVYRKVVEFQFSFIPIARPIADCKTSFNESELYVLQELLAAIEIIRQPRTRITAEITNMFELIRASAFKLDRGIRKLIKASKGLTTFQQLCENDKMCLIKYGSFEVLLMRFLFYNCESEYWTLTIDTNNTLLLKLDLLKNQKINSFSAYENYLRKTGPVWNSDARIIDLLTAILLFSPDRPNIINRDVIKAQQHIYMHLLQRYLLLKYTSECEAKEKFLKIMNTLIDINILCEIHKKYVFERDPQMIGELLTEILDLSPQNAICMQ